MVQEAKSQLNQTDSTAAAPATDMASMFAAPKSGGKMSLIGDIMAGVGVLANLGTTIAAAIKGKKPIAIGDPLIAGSSIFTNRAKRQREDDESQTKKLALSKALAGLGISPDTAALITAGGEDVAGGVIKNMFYNQNRPQTPEQQRISNAGGIESFDNKKLQQDLDKETRSRQAAIDNARLGALSTEEKAIEDKRQEVLKNAPPAAVQKAFGALKLGGLVTPDTSEWDKRAEQNAAERAYIMSGRDPNAISKFAKPDPKNPNNYESIDSFAGRHPWVKSYPELNNK